jgi:hypothetical protein
MGARTVIFDIALGKSAPPCHAEKNEGEDADDKSQFHHKYSLSNEVTGLRQAGEDGLQP